jgi:hypothetical protein
MFLAKGPPNPAPGPRFHRAVAPPRKDCRPYESRPRDCIPCDLAQRRAALGTMPNRPPVGCRQSLAALDKQQGLAPDTRFTLPESLATPYHFWSDQ